MYTNDLLDAYKQHKNFVQYKQLAIELGMSVQMLTEIRKGRANLKENLALIIADEMKLDKESVLIGLAADKAKSPQEQAIWASIVKKFDGHKLHSISVVCGTFALGILSKTQCALYVLC